MVVEKDNQVAVDPEEGAVEDADGIGPRGKWKYGLFDCGGILACQPLCVMGVCCDCVVWAQVCQQKNANSISFEGCPAG